MLGLFTEAESILDRFLGSSSGDSTLRIWLAVVLNSEANTMMDRDQAEAARPLLERAAALFRPQPDRPTPAGELALERQTRGEVLWDLARVLRALKMPTEASRADLERAGVLAACAPDELVDLALKETSGAVVIGLGKTDVSQRAKAVRELDLDQAAANLRLAVERGFKDLNRLEAHPDAPVLLSRDDLKSTIAGLKSSRHSPGSQPVNNTGKP